MIHEKTPHQLVDLLLVNPRIKLDIRYATADHFLGFPVYTHAVCYLHREVAKALSQVQVEVESKGLGLKVFDGYRPLPVQQLMWDAVQDERYVSNPAKNKGRHTRGTAVDLTLIDGAGHELEMPSQFDEFSEAAHSDFEAISCEAKQNRRLLKEVMEKYGFTQFQFEWWHFDFSGWKDEVSYPPLAVSFEELKSKGSELQTSKGN